MKLERPADLMVSEPFKWRRERDSNSRGMLLPAPLARVWFRPLTHLSATSLVVPVRYQSLQMEAKVFSRRPIGGKSGVARGGPAPVDLGNHGQNNLDSTVFSPQSRPRREGRVLCPFSRFPFH